MSALEDMVAEMEKAATSPAQWLAAGIFRNHVEDLKAEAFNEAIEAAAKVVEDRAEDQATTCSVLKARAAAVRALRRDGER